MKDKEKPILGLDLDGVCADYFSGLARLIGEHRGVNIVSLNNGAYLDRVSLRSWLPFENPEKFIEEAINEHQLYAHLPVIEGAVDAVRRIRQENGVFVTVITDRAVDCGNKKNIIADTVDWLEMVGLEYDDLCFVGDKTSVYADIYIDDSPNTLYQLSQTNQQVVAYDHPYNRSVLIEMRAKDWQQAEDMILGWVI